MPRTVVPSSTLPEPLPEHAGMSGLITSMGSVAVALLPSPVGMLAVSVALPTFSPFSFTVASGWVRSICCGPGAATTLASSIENVSSVGLQKSGATWTWISRS